MPIALMLGLCFTQLAPFVEPMCRFALLSEPVLFLATYEVSLLSSLRKCMEISLDDDDQLVLLIIHNVNICSTFILGKLLAFFLLIL